MTRLWADQPEFESWSEEIFYIKHSLTACVAPPTPLHRVRGFSPREVSGQSVTLITFFHLAFKLRLSGVLLCDLMAYAGQLLTSLFAFCG